MSRKRTPGQLIQKLRETSEYWFLEGLKNDVTPHVMGCLPVPIETEKQKCLKAGIGESIVNATLSTAWKEAFQRYHPSVKEVNVPKKKALDPKRTAALLGAEASIPIKKLIRKLAAIADDKILPLSVRSAARSERRKFSYIPRP